MSKYKITYNEGLHINKTTEVEAENIHDAIISFTMNNSNADFTEIKEVEE